MTADKGGNERGRQRGGFAATLEVVGSADHPLREDGRRLLTAAKLPLARAMRGATRREFEAVEPPR